MNSGIKATVLGLLAATGMAWLNADTAEAQQYRYVNPSNHFQNQGLRGHFHQDHYVQDKHYHTFSGGIQFAGRTHLDTLAADLKYSANRIAWDMYQNYANNPGYRETYRETYKMLQDSKHIYELIYDDEYHLHQHPGGEDHIAADLLEISGLYNHIQEDIARWQPSSYNPYHDTGLLHAKMQKFGETLNHIMADYGIQPPQNAVLGGPTGSLDPPPPSGIAP